MTEKLTFDDICRYLNDNGFRSVSVNGSSRQIFLNEDKTLSVSIEERFESKLTPEEEERIKRRLQDLGYLDI